MYLQKLSCYNYRNLTDLSFTCNENINCIIGRNGVGKTNILDSIYYLAFCKSNFASNDALHIKHDESSFMIQGNFIHESQATKIHCAYSDKEKVISINDKKHKRFSAHIGSVPLIFISPADISLINDGASERRRFIDSFISLLDKEYLQNLVTYTKVLAQRNMLLKQSNIDYTYISILDESLCAAGTAIYNTRKAVIEDLSGEVTNMYARISSNDMCGVAYESQLQNSPFETLLANSFTRDKALTHTSVGIHRDDVLFTFNGGLLKHTGSQGQKKSYLLALKFAQYFATKEKKKTTPILLLDDLFDKLDKERTEKVFNLLGGDDFGQIFITDTNKILLHSFLETQTHSNSIWTLENGQLLENK